MAVRIGCNACCIFLKFIVTHWSHFRGELFCVQFTVVLCPVELAKGKLLCVTIKSQFCQYGLGDHLLCINSGVHYHLCKHIEKQVLFQGSANLIGQVNSIPVTLTSNF